MKDIGNNKGGFSLIELLIVLAISGIVLSGIYSVYSTNQKVFTSQQQVVEMEQNLRAATFMLVNDLRMAGYDPTGDAGAGIVTLGTNTITFTMDLDDDDAFVSTGESISYALDSLDGTQKLFRNPSTTPVADEVIADNIDALDFVYLEGAGAVTTTPADVRSIQISIVARTTHRTADGFVNSTPYQNLQNTTIYTAPGDAFRRRLLTSWIKCRNLGL